MEQELSDRDKMLYLLAKSSALLTTIVSGLVFIFLAWLKAPVWIVIPLFLVGFLIWCPFCAWKILNFLEKHFPDK